MTILDWRDGMTHFSRIPKPCRICGKSAFCRDDDRIPCHKVCAEAEINKSG